MKIYRFAVHPAENNYYFVECLNDPALFTQARSMDEVVMMARDVVAATYEFNKKDILIELVIPPDVTVKSGERERPRSGVRPQKRKRARVLAAH